MPKKPYDLEPKQLILRDHLAVDRTALANERNLLAYIRTALAFAAGGFGLIKFTPEKSLIVVGWILAIIGIFILSVGILRFLKFRKIISSLGCSSHIEETKDT